MFVESGVQRPIQEPVTGCLLGGPMTKPGTWLTDGSHSRCFHNYTFQKQEHKMMMLWQGIIQKKRMEFFFSCSIVIFFFILNKGEFQNP